MNALTILSLTMSASSLVISALVLRQARRTAKVLADHREKVARGGWLDWMLPDESVRVSDLSPAEIEKIKAEARLKHRVLPTPEQKRIADQLRQSGEVWS